MRIKTIKRIVKNILGRNKSIEMFTFFLKTIFKDDINYQLFLDINNGKTKKNIFEIFVKEAGEYPLLCRPNTSDTSVLLSVFLGKYHESSFFLGESPIILDLGANNGYSMRHLKFIYPKAKIYGFEMDPLNAEIATQNTTFFKDDCILTNAAVWTETGTITYSGINEESYSIDNSLKITPRAKSVNSITIHDIFAKFKIQKVDYLKMDIEGAEYDIFNKDISWLNSIKCINLEIHNPIYMEFFFEKLKSMGFDCKKHPRHWSSIEGINRNI